MLSHIYDSLGLVYRTCLEGKYISCDASELNQWDWDASPIHEVTARWNRRLLNMVLRPHTNALSENYKHSGTQVGVVSSQSCTPSLNKILVKRDWWPLKSREDLNFMPDMAPNSMWHYQYSKRLQDTLPFMQLTACLVALRHCFGFAAAGNISNPWLIALGTRETWDWRA